MFQFYKMLQIIFVIFFVQNLVFSQFQNIRITNLNSPNETTIMINPKNPNQIVAGANADYWYTDSSGCGYYVSTNGGLNWSQGPIYSIIARPCCDPSVAIDTNGYFYFTSIVINRGIPDSAKGLITNRSTDHGSNWSQGVNYGMNGLKFTDKPWTCVDLTHSSFGNYIYTTWTEFDVYASRNPLDSSRIMFSRSTDGGTTFSILKRISRYGGDCKDSSETVEGAVPCTGPNGEIYVSWAGPLGICFNKSTDGGITWLPTEITAVPPYPGGWYYNIPGLNRCNGMPITGCDISNGPFRGTIYINWSDQRNGPTDTDIWLIKSTNGGLTWSSIKRVNNNPPGKQQFYTWMSIDQVTGYLYFVFYDQRNYTGLMADVYCARSTDGGETFTNIKISQNPTSLNSYVFFGDYICISAYNNKVRPIWTRLNSGVLEIWTANIDTFNNIGVIKTSDQIPHEFYLSQNYPNPFNPSTKIKFNIAPPFTKVEHQAKGMGGQGGFVTLKIYDILGREIATLMKSKLQPGSYEVEWDATNFPSGVYFYKLIIDNASTPLSITKRMVLLK